MKSFYKNQYNIHAELKTLCTDEMAYTNMNHYFFSLTVNPIIIRFLLRYNVSLDLAPLRFSMPSLARFAVLSSAKLTFLRLSQSISKSSAAEKPV